VVVGGTGNSNRKVNQYSLFITRLDFDPGPVGETKTTDQAADHLVEDVLPLLPYRQMVLSENKAKTLGMKTPKAGSVAFTQRAGSALNLNPHLHVVMVDGVFTEVGGTAFFRNLPPMTDAEVSDMAEAIAKKVMTLLLREGLPGKDGEVVTNPDCDEIFRDHEGLATAFVAIANRWKAGGAKTRPARSG
jgi:hypothetical protein